MISVGTQWNPKQALLKSLLEKNGRFDEAIQLCLDMHSMVHSQEVGNGEDRTLDDELWEGLDEKTFRSMIKGGTTIAWNIWHLARIEDITANILIADGIQAINSENWPEKMNVRIRDTGNAMTGDEIMAFSSDINMKELRNYRTCVGRKTQEIIKKLKPEELKRKPSHEMLRRILDEGGVLEAEDSRWLIDFWGRKTVAGILLMPITRHQIVHLNDSFKIKQKSKSTK